MKTRSMCSKISSAVRELVIFQLIESSTNSIKSVLRLSNYDFCVSPKNAKRRKKSYKSAGSAARRRDACAGVCALENCNGLRVPKLLADLSKRICLEISNPV